MTAKQILNEVRLRTNTRVSDLELYRQIGAACDDVKRLALLAETTHGWTDAIIEATIRRLPQ